MSEIRWHTTSYHEMVDEPALMIEVLGYSVEDVRAIYTDAGYLASSWADYAERCSPVDDAIALVMDDSELFIIGDDWAIWRTFPEGETRYECWEGCAITIDKTYLSGPFEIHIDGGTKMTVTRNRYKTEAGDADE